MTINIEQMAAFCKQKGFVYQDSEIYGTLAGFWDFGPLGVELKNNIKANWWKRFVHDREDVVGMDGSIITNRKVWEASGHVSCFGDLMITCKKCKYKTRADQFLEDELNENYEGIEAKEVNRLLKDNSLICPKCKGEFQEAVDFNLMFETTVGPVKDKSNTAFLRPETAQLIFADFHLIKDSARKQLPFGIAQIGKAFRNEISPREFLFRSREFEQMEMEFFTHPDKINDCPLFDDVKKMKVNIITADDQAKQKEHKAITIEQLSKMTSKWHSYWIAEVYQWFLDMGIKPENLRIREHLAKELAHYAGACFDVEYNFPFGWKEIHGNADRQQFDMQQHIKVSGKDITIYDEETKQKVVPYVASEPSQGVDRAFLAVMFDAYENDEKRGNIVLHFDNDLTPIKVKVFPLMNKLHEPARKIFKLLQKDFICQYDKSGSVGRRYARADEVGVPYCVTVDFDGVETKTVTIRDRESTKQRRIKIDELKSVLCQLLNGEEFSKFGEEVKSK